MVAGTRLAFVSATKGFLNALPHPHFLHNAEKQKEKLTIQAEIIQILSSQSQKVEERNNKVKIKRVYKMG